MSGSAAGVLRNWNEFVRFTPDQAVAENNRAGPWLGALLLVLSVSAVDARLTLTPSPLDRFLFDLGWFLPALSIRMVYLLIRCREPRAVDLVDRYANALDTFWVLVCPAAIAITGSSASFAAFGLLFFAGTLFYAWVGGSGYRHPWVAVLAALSASVPALVFRDERSWMFLGVVAVPSVITGLVLGDHAHASHKHLEATWQRKEQLFLSGMDTTVRLNAELNRALVGLAGTHHDISNALTGALLSAAMLSRRASAQNTDELARARELERLQGQLRGLKAILESARSIAREAGAPTENALHRASLSSSLDEACRWLSDAGCQLAVERALQPGLDEVMAQGGRTGLTRMLFNLLLNAAQGDGQQGATCAVVRTHAGEGRVHVRLEDNGPGFRADQLSAPIQVFQTTKGNGTGLGLASVELAVRESGGTLRRANGTAGGAVVSFDLGQAPGGSPAALPAPRGG